jgi:hypothetical protein
MFLAIPHYLILVGLTAAMMSTTLVAGIAILVTGRYPNALFDFNVSVLRWHWRVGFYVYAALGTDKYPPFSFAADAAHPATFDVDYPERLSRGLVLIKWLLAIPHLVIIGLMVSVIMLYPWDVYVAAPSWGYSVFNLLVVVAGFFLLITGEYPKPMLDFLVGVDRWIYRVIAYIALMRDEYPPFTLDTGEFEPRD